jgi:hypothetical protein
MRRRIPYRFPAGLVIVPESRASGNYPLLAPESAAARSIVQKSASRTSPPISSNPVSVLPTIQLEPCSRFAGCCLYAFSAWGCRTYLPDLSYHSMMTISRRWTTTLSCAAVACFVLEEYSLAQHPQATAYSEKQAASRNADIVKSELHNSIGVSPFRRESWIEDYAFSNPSWSCPPHRDSLSATLPLQRQFLSQRRQSRSAAYPRRTSKLTLRLIESP